MLCGRDWEKSYTRGLKHMANYRGRLYAMQTCPNGSQWSLEVSYSMKVGKCFSDPLTRQVKEAVGITN